MKEMMNIEDIKAIAKDMVASRLETYPEHFKKLAIQGLTDMVANHAEQEVQHTDVGILTCVSNLLNHPIDIINIDGSSVLAIFDGMPSIENIMMSCGIALSDSKPRKTGKSK